MMKLIKIFKTGITLFIMAVLVIMGIGLPPLLASWIYHNTIIVTGITLGYWIFLTCLFIAWCMEG